MRWYSPNRCESIWVKALYPSLLIEWGFYPQHLGKEFLDTYSNIKKERIEAKHNGNKVKNETLKLTLNSVKYKNINQICEFKLNFIYLY